MKYSRVIMMGPPGCGKGTQSGFISGRYGIPHVSSGDIIREEMKKNTKEAEIIREMVNSGRLASDELVNKLVLKKVESMEKYILDGYPRRVDQAKMLGDSVDLVIFIDVGEETSVRRICGRKQGRDDDVEDVARKRHEVYLEETAPVVEFYREQGKLVTVNGEATPETIFSEICRLIG
ncbi:adenylate kinase [Encephalitozoon hellem]|nr:adenylate kinase [Encephalitozoon hellem]